MFREIRIYQKLAFLPQTTSGHLEDQFNFTDDELQAWSALCKIKDTQVENEVDEDELFAWYKLSQSASTGRGDELPHAKLLNPFQNRRNGGMYAFAKDVELYRLLSTFVIDSFETVVKLPLEFKKFKRAKFGGAIFGSQAWGKGKDMNFVARQNVRRVAAELASADEDSKRASTLTRLRPGRVLYYIRVELITSHTLAIETRTLSCHFAVCQWYQLHMDAETLAEARWMPSLGRLEIIPLAKIASAVIIAPLNIDDESSPFRVLLKPNQLVLWHPERMFIEV